MDNGTIKVRRGIAWFNIIVSILIFSLGVSVIIYADNAGVEVIGFLCLLLGGALAILSIPNFHSIVNINWTNESLNGPRALMRLSRHEMKWSEIVKIGLKQESIYYVEDKNRERIYWSHSYKDVENFVAVLHEKRPDLVWPKQNS